eukprot:CAMPEP_0170488754 /NCGR_PEP_ID=MMETSP0208-20121228/7231_1 /TAXON_ID=197538 /ORGANISM="Strombidium inclinatum, Strain S3" /LENGTH=177 /DNA_ID=CAMNT_0010763425 /DNA_START=372 /DNA_END=902 /DNA_ORIENTATION=+
METKSKYSIFDRRMIKHFISYEHRKKLVEDSGAGIAGSVDPIVGKIVKQETLRAAGKSIANPKSSMETSMIDDEDIDNNHNLSPTDISRAVEQVADLKLTVKSVSSPMVRSPAVAPSPKMQDRIEAIKEESLQLTKRISSFKNRSKSVRNNEPVNLPFNLSKTKKAVKRPPEKLFTR